MKIKGDFVTNSSSTSYVVLVPNEFRPDDDEIKKLYTEEYSFDDELSDEQLLKELPELFEILKEGEDLWYYGGEGTNQSLWGMILDICRTHDFLLTSLDMNGEGNNTIIGIKEEAIESIMINNIDLFSMFNQIQRRGSNVTAKTK